MKNKIAINFISLELDGFKKRRYLVGFADNKPLVLSIQPVFF